MESVQKPPRGGHLDVGASWDDFYGRQTNIFSPFVYDVRFNERCDRIQPSVQLIQTCEGRLHTYSIANLYSSGFFLGNERENQREKGGVRFSMSASGGCIQTRERKIFFLPFPMCVCYSDRKLNPLSKKKKRETKQTKMLFFQFFFSCYFIWAPHPNSHTLSLNIRRKNRETPGFFGHFFFH